MHARTSAGRWLHDLQPTLCALALAAGLVAMSGGSALAQEVAQEVAQEKHRAEETENDSADYQRLVQQALREYELGNFNEAKAFFTQAHALSPSARTLRGLGMSSYELRNYVEAIGYFERALNSPERPLTAQLHGEVAQLLKQARAFVTRLLVTLEPADAELRVDTRAPVKDAAGYVLLDPGAHELVAEAPEHDTLMRNLRTAGGEELKLTMSLRSSNNEPKVEAPPQETTPPTPVLAGGSRPAQEESSSSIGPWIVIGSAAAVTITGGVLIGLMIKDKNAVENPSDDTTYAEVRGPERRVFPLSVAGFTALGVGVAGLVGGIAWKISSSSESSRTPDYQVRLQPGGMSLRGKF